MEHQCAQSPDLSWWSGGSDCRASVLAEHAEIQLASDFLQYLEDNGLVEPLAVSRRYRRLRWTVRIRSSHRSLMIADSLLVVSIGSCLDNRGSAPRRSRLCR